MGTKCAPSLAISFMHEFEQKFLKTYPITPSVWWRYIDDIFLIWPHSRQELNSLIMALNSQHNTIKFTSDISDKEIHFLDVTVRKDTYGNLSTTLYTS
jgi:hypothetical protein